MPEGILIVCKEDDKVEFMNEELREVLNMQLETEEDDGLKAQIFRKYDIVQEIKDTASDAQSGATDSLLSLIRGQDWNANEDRYYELEFQQVKDEDSRIFTQIRRCHIDFNERPATLLLIRNISHIINYEKVKNVGKYQELLTGTVSHEMLTPLNAIINFVQVLMQKNDSLLTSVGRQKDHLLRLINLAKEQLEFADGSKISERLGQNITPSGITGTDISNGLNNQNENLTHFILDQQRQVVFSNSVAFDKTLSV